MSEQKAHTKNPRSFTCLLNPLSLTKNTCMFMRV